MAADWEAEHFASVLEKYLSAVRVKPLTLLLASTSCSTMAPSPETYSTSMADGR
jgi:hypothetical protein